MVVPPKTRRERLRECVDAGRSALQHLGEVIEALDVGVVRGLFASLLLVASPAPPGSHDPSRVKRSVNLARSRLNVFWRGLRTLQPSVDVDREMECLDRLAFELDHAAPVDVLLGRRLRPLCAECRRFRDRLARLLEELDSIVR